MQRILTLIIICGISGIAFAADKDSKTTTALTMAQSAAAASATGSTAASEAACDNAMLQAMAAQIAAREKAANDPKVLMADFLKRKDELERILEKVRTVDEVGRVATSVTRFASFLAEKRYPANLELRRTYCKLFDIHQADPANTVALGKFLRDNVRTYRTAAPYQWQIEQATRHQREASDFFFSNSKDYRPSRKILDDQSDDLTYQRAQHGENIRAAYELPEVAAPHPVVDAHPPASPMVHPNLSARKKLIGMSYLALEREIQAVAKQSGSIIELQMQPGVEHPETLEDSRARNAATILRLAAHKNTLREQLSTLNTKGIAPEHVETIAHRTADTVRAVIDIATATPITELKRKWLPALANTHALIDRHCNGCRFPNGAYLERTCAPIDIQNAQIKACQSPLLWVATNYHVQRANDEFSELNTQLYQEAVRLRQAIHLTDARRFAACAQHLMRKAEDLIQSMLENVDATRDLQHQIERKQKTADARAQAAAEEFIGSVHREVENYTTRHQIYYYGEFQANLTQLKQLCAQLTAVGTKHPQLHTMPYNDAIAVNDIATKIGQSITACNDLIKDDKAEEAARQKAYFDANSY